MIRLLIVSDIRFYREGLAEILENKNSINVIGTAENVKQAINVIILKSPDVILLDMTMISSCESVGYIMSSCPDARLVALAISENEDSIVACAKAGIAGYVSRDSSIEQVIDALKGVVEGNLYCPRRIAERLIQKFKSLPELSDTPAKKVSTQSVTEKEVLLTQREKQIATLLYDGLSNKQIARNLTIEVSTVKNHVHNILGKMGVHSRMQAITLLHHQLSIE